MYTIYNNYVSKFTNILVFLMKKKNFQLIHKY